MPTTPCRRILIIDDMDSIHRDFDKALASARTDDLASMEEDLFGSAPVAVTATPNFELEHASQGLDGVALAQKAHAAGNPFALAFVDVRMPPGLDGIETIARLWQVDPRLEVVICTAYSDYSWQQMLEKLSRTAQFQVLSKPFDNTVVKQLAYSLTEKWNLARGAERSSTELERMVTARTEELSTANSRLSDEMRERAELERKLRHAQKLEALGRLVAGVAHEINNPLAFVLSNLEHIDAELEEQGASLDTRMGELREVAREARTGGERIKQIVRDLKTFSRPEALAVEDIDMKAVVEFGLRMAKPSFPSGITVSENYEPVPMPRGSSGQLAQVFMNLLVNAGHALSTVPENRRKVELWVRREGDSIVATVKDTGIGIPPEHLPRIFDPFFTTKGPRDGTGLGLSICHGIVKQLGGEIGAESRFGEGTAMTVRLPVGAPLVKVAA